MRAADSRKAAAALVAVLALGCASLQAQIAVIVNRSNPTGDFTLADLERLYLGRVTTFAAGRSVALGEYSPARRAFYRAVLHTSETAVSRHWIGVVFSERNATPPREFRDAQAVLRFVASTPGAICFIDVAAVSDDVKIVTIGGLGPRDPGYPLR